MGNLPRSRPGRRSDKRGGAGARAKKPASAAGQRKTATRATAKRPSAPRTTKRPEAPRPGPVTARSGGGDPLAQAVHLAGKVAAVGVRTAADIVKRLPRP
jgi:hypothetical protein